MEEPEEGEGRGLYSIEDKKDKGGGGGGGCSNSVCYGTPLDS